MGKTPKEKHSKERRRPYNYPRNAQAPTQFSGTESRNYSYPTGNVPRRIPVYNLPHRGISAPIPNQSFHFRGGRGYRGRAGGINRPLKPILARQRRPALRGKRVLSPPYKASAQRIMQSRTEVQESLSVTVETVCQIDGSATERIKNGPENCSSHDEVCEEMPVKKVENGSPEVVDNTPDCNTNGTDDVPTIIIERDTDKIQPKTKSLNTKEKKVKKSLTPVKSSPKGKHSPKSKKQTKPEIHDDSVTEIKDEKLPDKKHDLESRSRNSKTPELQPNVNVTRLSLHTVTIETNESVIEIPNKDVDKSHESAPSTSAEESSFKSLEMYNVKDSPRRSTRHSTYLSPPKQQSPTKADSSSIIVLDSDDSISVLEVRSSQEKSFAQNVRAVSGRRSLRQLPAYDRSFNRPSTVGSASVRSNFSSRSGTTTGNDSESDSQETKILRPKSGLWNLFRSPSRNVPSHDSATDNESTNRSVADDSGNDSEATTEPFDHPSNISFGKRKVQEAGLVNDAEQEHKRIRGESDVQNQSTNNSAGFFSIMSSPMNLFASKIMGDKGKSSTPVQVLKSSLIEETREDMSVREDVSEIQYESDPNYINEKEEFTGKIDTAQEVTPKRWCSIM